MSFRFQRIESTSQGYIQWFYARHPDLSGKSYAEQYAALMYDGSERADFHSTALRDQFGYETDEIVGNAGPMQKQWALEHGITYGEQTWMSDIALAQVKAFAPEVLYASSWLEAFGPDFVKRCRAACPSIKMVIGRVGEARPAPAFFRGHDLVISCAPDNVEYFQSQGLTARHLHHAFEPRILERIQLAQTKTVDIGFIGHLTFGDLVHNNRVRLFYQIAQQIDFTMYGLLSEVAFPAHGIKRYARQSYYQLIETLHHLKLGGVARALPRHEVWERIIKPREPYVPLYAFLQERTSPPVYGLEMYRTLSGFKVCLNAHGPSAYASNMRLYEATGVATCLLTDWKSNLPELFDPENEVVTYRDPEEAAEKGRYLLDHDDARREIAAAGQQRTLRDHTTARRIPQFHEYIMEFMRSR